MNEINIILFVQQKRKHDELPFLTSRNDVLLAFGVNCTARDAMKAKFTVVSN